MTLSKKKESNDGQENFEIDNNKKEILYERIGKKSAKKRENNEAEVNLDNQNKKKSKGNKPNFENTIQKWLEQ